MIPYIHTPWGKISTFTLSIAIGILFMVSILHFLLVRSDDRDAEEVFIFPKIIISGMGALLFAGLFDTVSKIRDMVSFELPEFRFMED